MKYHLIISLLLLLSQFTWSQKLVLSEKTAPAMLSYEEVQAVRTLDCSDKAVSIQSFSIRFELYGRPMEIVCQGNTFTEEFFEGMELFNQYGTDPKKFTIDKVTAFKDEKKVTFQPLHILIK